MKQLQKEIDELNAKSVDLTVPPAPDPYADDYAEQIVKRDEKIQHIADHKAKTSSLEADQQRTLTAQTEKEELALQERVASFDSNMLSLGLKPNEVKQAADTILKYGINDTFQDILLEDPDGPLFVQYLDKNPVELESLNGMSALQLINHLNTEVRPKANLLKPKTSQAPEPPITLQGGGVAELQESWLKGAKFE